VAQLKGSRIIGGQCSCCEDATLMGDVERRRAVSTYITKQELLVKDNGVDVIDVPGNIALKQIERAIVSQRL